LEEGPGDKGRRFHAGGEFYGGVEEVSGPHVGAAVDGGEVGAAALRRLLPTAAFSAREGGVALSLDEAAMPSQDMSCKDLQYTGDILKTVWTPEKVQYRTSSHIRRTTQAQVPYGASRTQAANGKLIGGQISPPLIDKESGLPSSHFGTTALNPRHHYMLHSQDLQIPNRSQYLQCDRNLLSKRRDLGLRKSAF
jgi:hypothetical protein